MPLSGRRYSIGEIQTLLLQAGWPDIIVNDSDGDPQPLIVIMSAIAISESQGYAGARTPPLPLEDSVGLLQINRKAWGHSVEELSDPLTNLRIAYDGPYKSRKGLNSWGPYFSGIYADNLPAAWRAYGGQPPPKVQNTGGSTTNNQKPDAGVSSSIAKYLPYALGAVLLYLIVDE